MTDPISQVAPTNSQTWEDERYQLKQQVYDLERQLRSVRLYGVGYLLKHGRDQMQLNPLDVTVVLPAGQPATAVELHDRIVELEQDKRELTALECLASRHVAELERQRDEVLTTTWFYDSNDMRTIELDTVEDIYGRTAEQARAAIEEQK